jgi:transcriptional regulator with XRE-family HTH domain
MTNLRKVLASNIKYYRKVLGISQAKLAEKAQITNNYIALVETGKRFPSVNVLEQIAKALEKDTVELFFLKQDDLDRKRTLKTKILADIDAILSIRLNETEI